MKSGLIKFAALFFSLSVTWSAHAQRTTQVPGRVQAEDYIAFYDTTPGNSGSSYRNDNVDIQPTSDNGGGFNVGWTKNGEWLEYRINVTKTANYTVRARIASQSANGMLQYMIDGANRGNPVRIATTKGWQKWSRASRNIGRLQAGIHTFRVNINRGDINLNWFSFVETVAAAPTPPAQPAPSGRTLTSAVRDGAWGNAATWNNGVPSTTTRAIIPQGRTVTIGSGDSTANGIVVQGVLRVGETRGEAAALQTRWMHINSNGIFQVGTPQNPYDESSFTMTLTGANPQADWSIQTANGTMQVNNNDGFLMAAMGGRLQMHGEKRLTYTRLSATATANSRDIYVSNMIERNYDGELSAASDGRLDWRVGDRIAIASSTYDYAQEEVRTISAIRDLGNSNSVITLDKPLDFRHYGEVEFYGSGAKRRSIDMRAEVAILNRNVKVKSYRAQDTDNRFGDRARLLNGSSRGVGGHIMIMGTAGRVNLDSVQLDRLGQMGRLGRYPMHWHLAGDRNGDSLRGVSITNSNNRGVTIHGTHNLLIQDVVLHDIHGHGFFMEDAVETGNRFLSNITYGIHKVGGVTPAELNDPFLVDTHDHAGQNNRRFLNSAGYWMTNPDNTWIGNVSAGSEGTGFWFLFPSRAVGESAGNPRYANVRPNETNFGAFRFNSSHSSPIGLNFDRGSDIEKPVGAPLKDPFNGDAYRPPNEPQVNNYTAYKHTTGIYHRARTGNFAESRFADNFTSTFITFTQRITNTLFVGHSRGNADLSRRVTGHTFYDGANLLDGSHFAGFNKPNSHMFRTSGVAIRHTHFVMNNTSYENDGTATRLSSSDVNGGLSDYNAVGKLMPSVLYDKDGTLTSPSGGRAGATVIPDHPFFYDRNDRKPAGWRNARLSDDLYAVFRVTSAQDPRFRVTTPDGDSAQGSPGRGLFAGTNTLMKKNAGEYAFDFPNGNNSAGNGFEILYFTVNGPKRGSTVVRFTNMAGAFQVSNLPASRNLRQLREANRSEWVRSGGHIYVKFFSVGREGEKVRFTRR